MKEMLEIDGKEVSIEVNSAGALLRNKKGEFLFEIKSKNHKKNPGGVALFGGLVESNDTTPLDTLTRELKEELSIDIGRQDVEIIFFGYEPSVSNPGAYHTRYFVDNIDDSDIVLSEESADVLRLTNLDDLDKEARKIANGVPFVVSTFIQEFTKS